MTPRLILFDCDGTLVDSAAVVVAAMSAAFRATGATPPPADEIRAIIGLSLPHAVATLVANRPDAPVDAIAEGYRTAYRDVAVDTGTEPLFAGVREALDAIDGESTLLGIVTGKSRRGLNRILEGHGLERRFVTTQTADDAASKPDPEMVERALADTGAERSATVVIGDTDFDVRMAHAAGVRAIAVAWGNHPVDRLRAADPHAMARSVSELPGLIDALLPVRLATS